MAWGAGLDEHLGAELICRSIQSQRSLPQLTPEAEYLAGLGELKST